MSQTTQMRLRRHDAFRETGEGLGLPEPDVPAVDHAVAKLTLHGLTPARGLQLLLAINCHSEAELALCPKGTVDRLDVEPSEKLALLAAIALSKLQRRLRALEESTGSQS